MSGLGAKGLKKADGSEFSSGELTSSQIQHFVYNGTEFRLLGTVAATEDLIKINTLDIFQNTINDMADHSDNLLETVDGFTDNFQDGSTQNNTAFDLTNSSGVTHDNTNKLWGNTDAATGANDDKPYTTEANYIQEEWDQVIVGANAVFTNGSATVTTSGTFPTNCANGRISQDGTNWYDITTRDSATQLTLSVVFAQSTVTGTFDIRMTEFDSGVVKLNSRTSTSNGASDITDASSFTYSTSGNAGSRGADKLFDNTNDGGVHSCELNTATGFAKIDFGSGNEKASWKITYQNGDTGTTGVQTLQVEGSNNDSDYTVLIDSQAIAQNTTLHNLTVSDVNTYRYYKFVVEANHGHGGQCNMGEAQIFELVTTNSNPITEYVSVADSYSQSSDVSAFLDINSLAITETLNSQNAYYWLSFDPASSYGAGTEIVVPKPAVHTYGSDVTSGETFFTNCTISGGAIGNAFDDNASTSIDYLTTEAFPRHLGVQFGSSQQIGKVVINVNGSESRAKAVSFIIAGSNDGASYTTLHTVTGHNFGTGSGNTDTFTFTNATSYTYYKVEFTASTHGAALPTWYEMEMITVSSTSPYIRPIAKNDSGTWKHNSNASANNTFTAATSTVNDMLHSVSQAVSSQAQNRLTGTEISSLVDADFNLTNGFTTSDSKLTRGLTLVSSSASQNPEVSLFRVNYDADKADGTFLTRAFGGTNMPPAPSGNIDTMVALIIDKRTTGTPVYEASSNAGTTYTAFSTWIHEEVMSNGYTKRMAEIDVSAHSGSRVSPLIRITNGSIGEDYDLKAIGIKYK